MILYRPSGRPWARFCNWACASGFKSDRRAGAIYVATFADDGAYSAEAWSLRSATCAYCGGATGRLRSDIKPTWPNHRIVAGGAQ